MRIILASQVIEQQRARRLTIKLRSTLLRKDLTSMEQRTLDKVEDYLEEALGELRSFWEDLLRP